MKELFLHLWTSSRAFQVALVVGLLAGAWGLFGRPPSTSPPKDRAAIFDSPLGKFKVPATTEADAEEMKNKGKGVLSNAADATNAASGAIKTGADAVTALIKFGRRQVEGDPTPADPTAPIGPNAPVAPTNPKQP